MNNHFNTALSRLRRTPYQTLISLLVVSLTFFSASIFFMDAAAAHKILQYFERRPQVNAFFKPDLTPTTDTVELIKTQLLSSGLVESVRYISKEDALKIYHDLNAGDPLLLEAVSAEMLPASLEVSAKDPANLATIAESLKGLADIDEVRYEEEVVLSLMKWTRSVRTARIALTSSQIFITFIIMISVIGARVTSRREEIALLQLVGATGGFIISPFIIEGMLYGIFGGLIAWGATYLVFLYSTPFLNSFIFQIPELYPQVTFMLEVLAGELTLGCLIGAFAGLVAAHRYLKA